MTPERFRQIVEAYGATPQRWPEGERTAAEAFARTNPAAQTMLAREASLDSMLGAYRVAPAGSALVGAVIASARRRPKLSWMAIGQGFGIVGAGLAGVITGAFLMTAYAPPPSSFAEDDDQPILTSFDVSGGIYDLGDDQ